MSASRLIHLFWLPFLGYLLYLVNQLAFHESLTSIANDSVNYLAMARHYSPWLSESKAIQEVWPLQDFPPLFPLLLALTGAAHSLLHAHILVVLIGFACLLVLYKLAFQIVGSQAAAAAIVVLFALSPGYILGLQGILSETLYLLLSLFFLTKYQPGFQGSRKSILGLGILLAAILLTRTIGYALFAALLMQLLFQYVIRKQSIWPAILVPATALMCFLFVAWLVGPDRESHYMLVIAALASNNGLELWLSGIYDQLQSILNAWQSFWLIYWLHEYSFAYIVILLLLVISVIGWLQRLKANKLDAWYVFLYTLVLILWPHPGQMFRLLFPLTPVLLIYAFIVIRKLASTISADGKSAFSISMVGCVFLFSFLPAHAFIHGRLILANEHNLIPVHEFFRKPDVVKANRDLFIQNQMLKDFLYVGQKLSQKESALYFVPEYLAVLGGHGAEKLLYSEGIESIQNRIGSGEIKYILLTGLHPRMTREGIDGFASEAKIISISRKKWCSYSQSTGEAVSCLYRIEDH